jgi:3-oxoacyl-[acyl-carrier protein] reductase
VQQSLDGKLALVTGAARGIGRAIALRLAHEGAKIAAHGTKGAADTVQAIEKAGGKAISLDADLATIAGVGHLAAAFRSLSGRSAPDILVNNAGIQTDPRDTPGRIVEADFDRLIAVNVKAPLFLVQQFLADFPQGGRIVNLSSRLSLVGFPEQLVYSATKAAINSLTKSLAKELGPRGVTVNAVGPGLIETDMTRARFFAKDESRAIAASFTALKRTGQPDDIADIVAFLAGEDSRWITGSYFDASGGATL